MWTAILVFIFTLILGVPVAFSLGSATVVYLYLKGVSVGLIAQRMFTGLDSFPFMAIPFFILAGDLMNTSGITKKLVNFANVLVGHIKGGLGHVNIVSCMFFAGITGSAIADASAVGSMLIPAMEEEGFDLDFSAGLTASAAIVGPIIPPSIPFVIYSLLSSTSVAALFMAGMIPGILVGVSLMVVTYILAIRRNYPYRKEKPTFKEIIHATLQGVVPLLMPVIILGGILAGIFTATEASGVAVVYALVIGFFVYKNLDLKTLKKLLISTGKTTGVVFLIIACSNIFNWALVVEQVPQQMATFVAHIFTNKFVLLLAINIVLLIVGTFMEGTAAMIILVPILLKITEGYGIHPVMLGAIVVLNLMIGLLTPPVGLVLYTVCGITHISLERITKAVLPFLIVEIGVLFLVTYIEPVSMFLPRLFGYVK
ncbi:MAG: TRAP transporter large permease [Spirochaetes bacterium]|nr:TRAP transporter large permease [Spirochaetota bacterium]